jgi:Flp pilus assembly protein TadG
MKRFLASSSGSSAVELALTIPVLALLTIGVLNLSLFMFQAVRMQAAVRDAARCVVIGSKCNGDSASVNTYAAARWKGFGVRPTFTWSGAGCGNTVIATVDPYRLITGIGRLSFKLEMKACYPLQVA